MNTPCTKDLTNLTLMERNLPTRAPVLWVNRRPSEDAPTFIERVYGEWLGKGLTIAIINDLDPPLSTAISGHKGRNLYATQGNPNYTNGWPNNVYLPTKSEWTDRLIEEKEAGNLELTPCQRRRLSNAKSHRASKARSAGAHDSGNDR